MKEEGNRSGRSQEKEPLPGAGITRLYSQCHLIFSFYLSVPFEFFFSLELICSSQATVLLHEKKSRPRAHGPGFTAGNGL